MKGLLSYILEGTEKDKMERWGIEFDEDYEFAAIKYMDGYSVSPQAILDHKFYVPEGNVTDKELDEAFRNQIHYTNFKNLPKDIQEKIKGWDGIGRGSMPSFVDPNRLSGIQKCREWYDGRQRFVAGLRYKGERAPFPSAEMAAYIDTWIRIVEQIYPAKKRMTTKQIEKIIHKELMSVYKKMPTPMSKEEKARLHNYLMGIHQQFRPGDYR